MRLDELHTLQERKAARTGRPIREPVFTARQNALRWVALQGTRARADVRDGARATACFSFIKSMGQTGAADERSTYTHHLKDALFMMPTV